ncbi:type 1 glutamine amidotransferase domain-containing protein [Brevibacterium atlanticum]|uniref:type 1 glutamine amidotransferase domain-containing protein n=1 Tax=Brevibacterium atlanticum TaxID=2697563 RepID=UPI0014220C9A|nr:type 1 glutamine amidotransferase domain-containing protein [Brevibacterium atlanticum]
MVDVLFVVTAATGWTLKDGSVHPTGYWAEELAEPHRLFTEAGWSITVATPGGVPPTLDELSLGVAGGLPKKRAEIRRYLESISDVLDHPRTLAEVDEADFDLVFYPGGHGPMEDLAHDEVSGNLLRRRLESGKPLGLLCHAPAAILAATNPDGTSAFAGRTMTGLSNAEERLNPFAWKAKWLLQDAMIEAGVDYDKGKIPLRPHVVVDGALYSGQNPQTAEALATRIIADLEG